MMKLFEQYATIRGNMLMMKVPTKATKAYRCLLKKKNTKKSPSH